jgi:hypothetical protein
MTEADDLYGLPLERFTEERNALAKRLRQDGSGDEAAAVSKLKKPTVAAWAVNQLVRTQRRDVGALFDAGDALHKAQADVIARRGSAGELRQAAERERAAVAKLMEKARGLLTSQGHELTQATLDRVSETLDAAALDEHARSRVRDGRLERELRHVGLGAAGSGVAPATGRSRSRASEAKPPADRARTDRDRAEKLRAARKAAGDARRVAERARRELKAAQERHDRAAETLREAEDALVAARERANRAATASQQADEELGRATAKASE